MARLIRITVILVLLLAISAVSATSASADNLTIVIDPKPTSKPTQQYDLVKTGEADLTCQIATDNAKQFSMVLAGELPVQSAHTVTDSQMLWEWYTKHTGDKEYGAAKALTLWIPRQTELHSTHKLKTMDDFKDMKSRVPCGAGVTIAKAIGFTPAPPPMTKLPHLLQDGTIEGSLTGWRPCNRFRLESVLTHHQEAPTGALYTTPFILFINRENLDNFPPSIRRCLNSWGQT